MATCTYSALSIFRADTNGSSVVLRWIIDILGCTSTDIFGIVTRLRHFGLVFLVFWKEGDWATRSILAGQVGFSRMTSFLRPSEKVPTITTPAARYLENPTTTTLFVVVTRDLFRMVCRLYFIR